MVKVKKSLKRKKENRRGHGRGLIDTMDFAELERIRTKKKFLEKSGRLEGQKRRTIREDFWFMMGRARLIPPAVGSVV